MKKGVILIISCICLLSVVFVGFFGTKAMGIDPVIYIQQVEIFDMNGDAIKQNSSGVKTQLLQFDSNLTDEKGVNYMQYFLTTKVLPDNATVRDVIYKCDSSDFIEVTNSKAGAFLIKEKDASMGRYLVIGVRCEANDGGPTGINDYCQFIIDYGI